MIKTIRDLSPAQKRQLLRLLVPGTEIDELTDDELLPELVAALRRALEVPERDDLPDYLRRRLVEVVSRHFELVDDTDTLTDLELAHVLIDFALEAAQLLATSAEHREEFETFLRTKSRQERLEWLTSSRRFAAGMTDVAFDRPAARRRAEGLIQERHAHTETAKALLDDLGTVALKGTAAKTAAAAAAGSGLSAPLTASSTAALMLGPALAGPLGALAGGLFMAGRRKHELIKTSETEAEKTRTQRARRSKLVQTVVSLCAFLVAAADTDDR